MAAARYNAVRQLFCASVWKTRAGYGILEMSNARLLAEYDRLMAFIEAHNELYLEPVMARENELMSEMKTRMRHYEWKDTESPEFKRAVATSMAPLYKYLGRPNMDFWEEWDD